MGPPYLPSMIGLTQVAIGALPRNAYCMPPPERGGLSARSASAALRILKKPPPHDPDR
jgi:hypothetical protein